MFSLNNEIKEILDFLKDKDDYIEEYGYEYKRISLEDTKILLDYITNLQEELERLKDLYRKTCNHLFNIGNDELARYFQAQINECNTFTTQGVGKDE